MSYAGNFPGPDRARDRARDRAETGAPTATAGRAPTSGGASGGWSGGVPAPSPATVGGRQRTPGRGGQRSAGRQSERVAERGMDARGRGEGETDWARVGAFGLGIALGALIGAGAALLYAPQSGRVVRARLGRRARRLSLSAGDSWGALGLELRGVARRRRRELSRGVTRGRWKAADVIEG